MFTNKSRHKIRVIDVIRHLKQVCKRNQLTALGKTTAIGHYRFFTFFSSLPALLLFYVLYFYFSVIILLCLVTCSTVFSMSYVLNESKQTT